MRYLWGYIQLVRGIVKIIIKLGSISVFIILILWEWGRLVRKIEKKREFWINFGEIQFSWWIDEEEVVKKKIEYE